MTHPNHKISVRFSLAALAVTLQFVVCAGCQNFDLRRRIPWKTSEQIRTETPIKIMVAWSDAVRNRPSRRSVRGFGGRVYFYGKKEGKPIAVDGSIVVYAFDESERSSDNAVPDRKYVFPPNQVAQLHSETSLGHSYSLWLPWDAVGGDQKEISLIVRFEPSAGPVVVGNQTTSLLPGHVARTDAPTGEGDSTKEKRGSTEPVQRAGFETPERPSGRPLDTAAQPPRRMSTTTISVGERWGRPLPSARRRQERRRNAGQLNREISGSTDRVQRAVNQPRQVTDRSDGPVETTAAHGPMDRLQRASGFPRAKPRAPIGPVARPELGRLRWPQYLEGSTSAPSIQDRSPGQ